MLLDFNTAKGNVFAHRGDIDSRQSRLQQFHSQRLSIPSPGFTLCECVSFFIYYIFTETWHVFVMTVPYEDD